MPSRGGLATLPEKRTRPITSGTEFKYSVPDHAAAFQSTLATTVQKLTVGEERAAGREERPCPVVHDAGVGNDEAPHRHDRELAAWRVPPCRDLLVCVDPSHDDRRGIVACNNKAFTHSLERLPEHNSVIMVMRLTVWVLVLGGWGGQPRPHVRAVLQPHVFKLR